MMIPWYEAVALALTEPVPVTEPAKKRFYLKALQDELSYLWSDLADARRHAYDGVWSAQCDWITGRIVTLTRLIGATPWERIPCDLLIDGTYAGILDQVGVKFERPDLDVVRQVISRQKVSGPGGEPG